MNWPPTTGNVVEKINHEMMLLIFLALEFPDLGPENEINGQLPPRWPQQRGDCHGHLLGEYLLCSNHSWCFENFFIFFLFLGSSYSAFRLRSDQKGQKKKVKRDGRIHLQRSLCRCTHRRVTWEVWGHLSLTSTAAGSRCFLKERDWLMCTGPWGARLYPYTIIRATCHQPE